MQFITKGKANIKYLLITGLVAAIAGGVIFIYLKDCQKEMINLNIFTEIKIPVKNIEAETANWKIYMNEEYGFEFKYPGDYDNYAFCKIEEIDNTIKIGNTFSIEVFNPQGLSLLDYVAKEKERLNISPPAEEWTQQKTSIGSVEGIKVIWSHGPRYSKMIYLLRDSKIYKISLDAGINCSEEIITKNIPSELDVFEQIPFTFKFIGAKGQITISSPKSREIWKVGGTYKIRWEPSNPNEVVEIRLNDLSAPTPGLTNQWAKANIPNNGEYSFTVPDFPLSLGNVYRINIVNRTVYDPGQVDWIYGNSDLFSIVPK